MRREWGYTPGIERDYVPDVLDNRKDEDPVTVTIRQPFEGERFALVQEQAIEVSGTEDDPVLRIGKDALSWIPSILKRHVTNVRNWLRHDGQPISTGEDIWKYGHSAFAIDIAREILQSTSLGEQAKKDSSGHSDCACGETEVSLGTAGSVSDLGSRVAETVSSETIPAIDKQPQVDCCLTNVPKPGLGTKVS